MTASSEAAPVGTALEPVQFNGRRTAAAPLVVLVGPTAVGKTALSLQLASEFDAEVVSADSRLFYRGMDIGTAKPTPSERSRVRHHLIDIAEPDQTVGLAQFSELATVAIRDIQARRRLPLLVGGTGQYIRAIVEGWRVPRVPPDPALRRHLEATATEEGGAVLHNRLADLDPESAASIDRRNVRRVIRALEICLVTGRRASELRSKRAPPYRVLQIGLTMRREDLYDRADQRVDAMIAQGLENEVRTLTERGYPFRLPAMSGLGYAQFEPYFAGGVSLAEVAVVVKRATHILIRRQYNWFRLTDPAIRWFDVTDTLPVGPVLEVARWLGDQASQ